MIAIARAMLKDAPILILDEATSLYRSGKMKHGFNQSSSSTEGRTLIAHRLSTGVQTDSPGQ